MNISPRTRCAVTQYRAVGEFTGTTVLLHGFASDGTTDWPASTWITPLTEIGRDVIVPDLPGHGRSIPLAVPGPFTTSMILAELEAVLKSARPGSVDIVGYSLGARLGWDLVRMTGQTVHKVVLGGLNPQEPFRNVDIAQVKSHAVSATASSDPLTATVAMMVTGPGQDTQSLLKVVAGLAREPFVPTPDAFTVPTLLIGGADDTISQGMEVLTDLLGDARAIRIPGDHVSALQGPHFAAAAIGFLGEEGGCAPSGTRREG